MTAAMRISHSAKLGGGESVRKDNTYEGEQSLSVDESVTDGSVDMAIDVSLDISAMKGFYMMATQDMDVKTNDASTPQETFNLKANVPVIWEEGDDALFAGDVSGMFVSNASGSDGKFKLGYVADLP